MSMLRKPCWQESSEPTRGEPPHPPPSPPLWGGEGDVVRCTVGNSRGPQIEGRRCGRGPAFAQRQLRQGQAAALRGHCGVEAGLPWRVVLSVRWKTRSNVAQKSKPERTKTNQNKPVYRSGGGWNFPRPLRVRGSLRAGRREARIQMRVRPGRLSFTGARKSAGVMVRMDSKSGDGCRRKGRSGCWPRLKRERGGGQRKRRPMRTHHPVKLE
jgi:hypothetical protein